MFEKQDIEKVKSLIVSAKNIVIIPHLNPDGDAMGSSLGLYHVFSQMKKNVSVVLPSAFPHFLSWLPEVNATIDFEQNRELAINKLAEVDLLLYVDFNSIKRLGKLADIINNYTVNKIMIDHHPYPDEIADVLISVPESSSTCELAYELITSLELDSYVNENAAECFYTGIMTDTGSLSYNSSNPQTYRIVANLLEKGIDKDKIHQLVFHSNSFYRMKLLGHVLGEKMILMPEQKAAYLWLTKKELEDHHFEPGDTEGFVNYPLGIEGINISAFFMEADDKVKCSFRSQGEFPVNRFSELFFNGGGHQNAAGGESFISIDETIEKFKSKLPEFYQNFINHAK